MFNKHMDFSEIESPVCLLVGGSKGTNRLAILEYIKGTKSIVSNPGNAVSMNWRTRRINQDGLKAYCVETATEVNGLLRGIRRKGRWKPDWIVLDTWDELSHLFDAEMMRIHHLDPLKPIDPSCWKTRNELIKQCVILAQRAAKKGVIVTCHTVSDGENTDYRAPHDLQKKVVAVFNAELVWSIGIGGERGHPTTVTRCVKVLPEVKSVVTLKNQWQTKEGV
jgi:hypothetical protein